MAVEQICISEYQDVYLIKNGVMLIINKFELDTNYHGSYNYNGKTKPYKKFSKNLLILKENYNKFYDFAKHEYVLIPKNTIIYINKIVKLTSKENWNYIISTNDYIFNGNKHAINFYLDEIKNIINTYY